jgi:hypothetical protein
MPILYNVGNKLTAGSEPPQLYRYQDRVLGDGGTLETRDEASTFIRRLRSAGVLGSTVIAGVAGGVKAGTLYSIIGPDLDVTRGTVKNRVNRAGVLSEVASGVPATDFAGGVLRGTTVEPSAVNQIRNNTMQGAVVGVAGSGGSRPTNWTAVPNGLTTDIIASSLIDGIEYIDIRLFGTASATTTEIRFEELNHIVASVGQTWTNSFWFQIIAQPSPPVNYRSVIYERTSAGSYLTDSTAVFSATTSFLRNELSRTLTNTGVQRVQSGVSMSLVNGQSYDFTVRIGLPQMELGSVATSVIKTTGSAQTRNADVITKTGLGSVLPQTEGWVYAEVDLRNLGAGFRRILVIDNGDENNATYLRLSNIDNRIQLVSFNVTVQALIATSPNQSGIKRILGTFKNDEFKLFVNGVLIGSDTSGTIPALRSILRIGSSNNTTDSTHFLNDPIHSYAIGSGAITDASAIQLTTL